jgi:molybdate transport system substrate-binding protein
MKLINICRLIIFFITSIILFSSLSLIINLQNTYADPKTELTVSAAASLRESLLSVQSIYQTNKPNNQIIYNFGSSGSLQQQIEQGAPVDIFISAASKQMDELQKKGLIVNDTRKNLLKNKIVLIVPKDNQTIVNFRDLATNKVKSIALGEPESVPAGKYARKVLSYLGILDNVKSKAVYGKDVRQVLNYVATGNVDAGIVYLTDAKTSSSVKVVEIAPEKSYSPVVYSIAAIKNSKKLKEAKELISFFF